MEKGTIWVVLISIVLMTVLMFVLGPKNAASQNDTVGTTTEFVEIKRNTVGKYKDISDSKREKFEFKTDVMTVTFDTEGASVSSMLLTDFRKEPAYPEGAEVVFRGKNDSNAFLTYWGDSTGSPVNDVFDYRIEGKKVIFTNRYRTESGKEFTLVKTYEFKDGDYLFALKTEVQGEGLENGSYAYSYSYGPQVGPGFTSIKNNNYDYRRFYAGVLGKNGKVKRKPVTLDKGTNTFSNSSLSLKWFDLTSKYFMVIACPVDNEGVKYQAVRTETDTLSQSDTLYVSIPTEKASSSTVYFYCGPQQKSYLKRYYNGTDNAWGIRNLNLDDAMESGTVLGWLENILKWCLTMLHKVIPNYGFCIIVLTVILKLVTWPLTKKSMSSTSRMTALTPKVEEIKAKYPDNPQKQNLAMQQLYKEEGVNPMGGCLPMLLQFPILIAFYGLLNKHFELSGEPFIWWIHDLSLPETVCTFSFRIPLLGNELHLLPIIYTVSMIFSMLYTQASSKNAPQQGSMKFMTYGMPIMFFFILYSAPSGLLLYWTCQNALSIVQQIYTNGKVKTEGADYGSRKKAGTEKKEPEIVRRYQEKLRKMEEMKALAEKESAKKK
ncbi:MAG: membrane protein insertase YidC [Sphaerochaetaceae bacterium]|nr:membrane protein insertase YidC [Sphaerochaetaceae bacterium]